MNLDEILYCRIPEGKHRLSLLRMQHDIYTFIDQESQQPLFNSLIESFNALYKFDLIIQKMKVFKKVIERQHEALKIACNQYNGSDCKGDCPDGCLVLKAIKAWEEVKNEQS